jgi:hypothetical protein
MSDYRTTYPPQAPPEHLRPNDLYIREYAQGVWIPLLQNFFGGLLGAGGFVGIIGWKLSMTVEDAAILGATVGGLIFCAVTAFRAFRDEARTVIAAYGERQDKATRAALQAEVDQLRREVKELRSQGIITSKMSALMATERLLGDYYERHLDITRAPAMSRGYSRAQWDAAMVLLRAAQIVNDKGGVLVPTFAEAWARILHMQSSGMGSFAVTETGDVVRKA